MDLKQLEYFVRVAELGSFTKASTVLNIAQPALSRQIRLLELEFRQNLLIRNGRGVTTTEAGKVLLEHGRGILHQVVRAKEDLNMVRSTPSGRVALGLPPSMTKVLTVPLTKAFRTELPDANLSISEGLSVSMQEWLLTGRLDIALLYNPNYSAELETIPLLEEDLYFIEKKKDTTPSKPISLDEIASYPLVMPVRPNALRMLVETQLSQIGKKANIVLEIDGVNAILDLIEENAGYGVLPKYAIKASGKSLSFKMRPITNLTGKLVIATAANRASTLTQHKTIQMVQTIVKKVMGDGA